MIEKNYNGYVIINWRQDKIRFRKTKPEPSPSEVAFELALEVAVPETSIPTISQRIEVPELDIIDAVAEVYEQQIPDECPECGESRLNIDEEHGISICQRCGTRWGIDPDLIRGDNDE